MTTGQDADPNTDRDAGPLMTPVAVLFSGGKDSCYAMHLARRAGYAIACLVSVVSRNPDSYMFHTPSITCVEQQAAVLGLPLVRIGTDGEKEAELADLADAIRTARDRYGARGVVTGAVGSVYQASRVQRICHTLGLECYNPLWQKDQLELLDELVHERFVVIVTGVSAYPLDETWLGRAIDAAFIVDAAALQERYRINPAGEGGEFETLVLDCPMFARALHVVRTAISGGNYAYRLEVELE